MTAAGPLAGITVLDFTRVFAGPFATQILGDLGADVIKLERVDGGDESRDYGLTETMPRPGAPFLSHNRNKRSVAVDLKTEDGRAVVRRLAETADVLIHNYRPGVMERLHLDHASLTPLNARLVYCSISGFGAHGPMRTRAANDLSIQAYSGLLSITGQPGGPPARVPTSVCDLTAGLYAAIGIQAALHHRSVSGVGQEVSTSMLEGQLTMLNHFLTDYWMNGRLAEKMGTANALGLPNEAFPTKDGWVCITSANEKMWRRCAAALGVGELADDPRFRTLRDRYAHREELVTLLSRATSAMTSKECLAALEEGGVPCCPVNTLDRIATDPLLDALGSTVDMEVEGDRTVRLVQTPLRFSATQVSARIPPPRLGEHTDDVLAGAGFAADEIARMRAAGAVA
ncbi:CaiB/BaiF CoA transferase family protein [Streptomyces sp. SBT349]|uniref:CaiB/BaiF CoA transferase family protein n=1 Tax=Streptomyces sp. SBT349 TaxID=1580539 RepID=UPI00066D2F2B|nr:CaiB/BaiF CoA-transferase family protein [Streptomyces sp. SBT349]